jgi:hypothetical protein
LPSRHRAFCSISGSIAERDAGPGDALYGRLRGHGSTETRRRASVARNPEHPRALYGVFANADLDDITPETLADYGLVRYAVRDDDVAVDLTQRIGEVFRLRDLEVAEIDYLGSQTTVVTPRTLVRMQRDSRRPQDQLDVARLRKRFDLEDVDCR